MLLGYASHLLGDSATKSGLLLLYPNAKRYHPLPQGRRFTMGSLAEEALFVPLAISGMALLLCSLR